MACPSSTKKLGDTWQYVIFILSLLKVIVYPPPPRNPTYVITPSTAAIRTVPSGAPMSIPLWKFEAPAVGLVLFPKGDVIYV